MSVTPQTGVVANHSMEFGISATRAESTFSTISDVETYDIAFDGQVQEWTPYDTQGWTRRLMTAKSVSVSCSGKRNYGDAGNDQVAGYAMKNGQDCNTNFKITFANGDYVVIPCVVNTTKVAGGASTDPAGLEFEIMSDGKPTYTEYSA